MRLDLFLVSYKKIESRSKAQELISQGYVYLTKPNQEKIILKKANFIVNEDMYSYITIQDNDFNRYVSRGALKLLGALDKLQLNIANKIVFDIGQSTGGFTDVLLQKGAQLVVGVDVGQDQLHAKIKSDARVKYFEKVNVKDLSSNTDFTTYVLQKNQSKVEYFDLLVCDVSFISLTKIISQVAGFLKNGGSFLFLVKPQFECGPEFLDKNGLVKNEKIYSDIEKQIKAECEKIFNCSTQFFESSITGKDGNKEFFIYGQKHV